MWGAGCQLGKRSIPKAGSKRLSFPGKLLSWPVSDSSPVRGPEWERLIEQRNALRTQIAAVLSDLDDLEEVRPVILGQYAEAFGDRLIRLQTCEIESARLKREIELVQAAHNSGQEIDYHAIQETLQKEFAEWQEQLEAEANRLENQKKVLDDLLDPATARQLQVTFRTLVKRLHPDLNPNQTTDQAEWWHRAVAAKQAQNLEELSALEIVTRDLAADSADFLESNSPLEDVRQSVAAFRAQLSRILQSLAETRKQWPFDQMPILDDPDARAEKQSELDQRIATAEALRDERRRWLNLLLDH